VISTRLRLSAVNTGSRKIWSNKSPQHGCKDVTHTVSHKQFGIMQNEQVPVYGNTADQPQVNRRSPQIQEIVFY